jgi:FkbM family methyltransferase
MDLKPVQTKLKAQLRRALAAADLEVHRASTTWRRSLPPILAHYRALGLAPATVIDVGVGPGTPDLYEGFPDAHLVLVEPLEPHEHWRPYLQRVREERSADVVMAAAGAEAGEIRISVDRAPWCSSTLGPYVGESSEQEWRTVPMVRLDDVAGELALNGPFVLKVDVEGAELEVLKGATNLLAATDLVLLELSLFELVPGTPLLHEVVAWMDQHGFVIGELYDGHTRLLDGSLARLDGAFVKADGQFRREHAYATADQARQLYESWGL